ncbi:hypothetical protein LAZ67_13002935, partial [Cordylochernes scorpioides]
MFTNASAFLYKATKNQVFFRQVIISLPRTWSSKPEYSPAAGDMFQNAEVRVDQPNPNFGHDPYTLQPGGCGDPGLYVHFTPDFILGSYNRSMGNIGIAGRQVVHEWAHLRYGVFDEYGIPGDSQYPAFYMEGKKGISIEMLHRAATRFIADRVPDGAKLGMVKFSTDASVVSPLTKVDNTSRVQLLSQIPNSVDGWTAIGKALNTGLKVLGPQSQGGMIVLVTDDEENRGPSIVDVTPSIQKAGVTVNAVAFGDRASIKLEQLIKATDGVGFYFDLTEKTLAKIDMAFLSSMTSQYDVREQPVTVKGREDVNDEERAGRPSTSTTDEKINEVEKMILANRRSTVAEDLNISIGSCHSIFINDLGMRRVAAKFVPKLLDCDQKQHRMNIVNEMLDSVRDDPNLLQRVITGDEAWVYGYDVETKAQSSQWKLPHEPRPKKARQVRSNDYEPVLGARIVATIDRPMGSLVDIVLLDNGAGADGTRDDGIYTAFFTQFNGNGRYSVVARAVNSGQAGVRIKRGSHLSRSPPLSKSSHLFKKESTTGFPLEDFICREDELPEEDPRNLLEDFERSAFTGAFRVQAFPKDGIVKDVFPPCPVTDLRVTKVDGDVVSLRWTSPGDDLDYGNEYPSQLILEEIYKYLIRMWCFSVSSIEVRFGENFETLLKNFTSSKMVVEKDLVNGTLDPPPPGHYHEISIKVPVSLEEPKTVFFAVVGVDKSAKRAEGFSIFPANLGKLCRDPYNFTLDWKIGVAIILLVAVISIVIVIIYLCCRRQKDKIPSVGCNYLKPGRRMSSRQNTTSIRRLRPLHPIQNHRLRLLRPACRHNL